MDSVPSETKNDKTKTSDNFSNAWDVFQSFWIRRDSNFIDKVDRVLLRSELGFVFPCGILFWIILLIFGQ